MLMFLLQETVCRDSSSRIELSNQWDGVRNGGTSGAQICSVDVAVPRHNGIGLRVDVPSRLEI